MDIQVNVKRGLISAIPGHPIKDGKKCGHLQGLIFESCYCYNVTCENSITKIETVTIQRTRYDRRGVFSNGYLDDPLDNWQLKYGKPIRTFLTLGEVKFY